VEPNTSAWRGALLSTGTTLPFTFAIIIIIIIIIIIVIVVVVVVVVYVVTLASFEASSS
jgi:hypothetical protein